MMNGRRVLGAMTILALVGLAACGGGGTSSPTAVSTPAPAQAVIKVLIDPNRITAVPTGDPSYPWDFRVNIQLSDSGGVGFIVTSMQTTVTSALSGGVLTTSAQNPFVGEKIAAFGQSTKQYHVGAYRPVRPRSSTNRQLSPRHRQAQQPGRLLPAAGL